MISKPTDFSDPDVYFKLLGIWSNQQHQDQENNKAHDEYASIAASWLVANQQNQNLGLTIQPTPIPPKRKQYNDDGTVTLTDFPDLKVPTLAPVIPVSPSNVTGLVLKDSPKQLSIDQKLDAILILLNSLVR